MIDRVFIAQAVLDDQSRTVKGRLAVTLTRQHARQLKTGVALLESVHRRLWLDGAEAWRLIVVEGIAAIEFDLIVDLARFSGII